MLVSILMAIVFSLSAPRAPDGNDPFDLTKEAQVREAVYSEEIRVTSDFDFQSKLVLPKALETSYTKHPQAVLGVLLKIMEGGRPRDSALAAGYAISLLDGTAVGVICVEHFDKKTYDSLDKDWRTTPRRHWIAKVNSRMKKEFGRDGKQLRRDADVSPR
jgi:hypothetical protein